MLAIFKIFLIVCVCSPGPVGKTSSCLMVAASVPCRDGHTPNAEVGAEQWPTAAAAAAAPAVARINRPLCPGESFGAPGAVPTVEPEQPSQGARTTNDIQLKDASSLLARSSPPPPRFTNIITQQYSPIYLPNKRFKLWRSTRTALSVFFRDNVPYVRRQRKCKKKS